MSSTTRTILGAALFFAVVFVAAAQQPTAQVTGLITDASGAAVPGANIEITGVNTGVTQRTTSNNSGNYVFPVVKPGQYNITAHKQGFDAMTRTGLELTVGQIARFDFALQIGGTKQTVEVSSATPPLETSSASIGQVIGTKPIEELSPAGQTFRRCLQSETG